MGGKHPYFWFNILIDSAGLRFSVGSKELTGFSSNFGWIYPAFTGLGKKATLPETNSSPLEMDGWNTIFLLGMAYFQVRTVSFREGILSKQSITFTTVCLHLFICYVWTTPMTPNFRHLGATTHNLPLSYPLSTPFVQATNGSVTKVLLWDWSQAYLSYLCTMERFPQKCSPRISSEIVETCGKQTVLGA